LVRRTDQGRVRDQDGRIEGTSLQGEEEKLEKMTQASLRTRFCRTANFFWACRGLSLVELSLAFLILALAIVPVISLCATSVRQVRQTSDYGLAITLEEKVAEEARLATWENVHFADQVDTASSYAVGLPVVEGSSPFFRAIEDDRLPYGEIRDEVDQPISPMYTSLHRELGTFQFGVSSEQVSLTTGEALDMKLHLCWIDFQQSLREIALDVRLARRQSWVPPPSDVEVRDRADNLVRDLFYPGQSPRTLNEVASKTTADLATIRNVGDVAMLSKAFADSTADFRSEVARAESATTAAKDPQVSARSQLALGRAHEKRAATCLSLLCYMIGPLKALAATFEPAKLGNPPPGKSAYAQPILALTNISTAFSDSLGRACEAYTKAYNEPLGVAMSPRLRVRTFMKVLETTKLMVLTTGPADTSTLKTILAGFEKFHFGRNPNFAKFAEAESKLCVDLATLKSAYPAARYEAFQEFRNVAAQASAKLLGTAYKNGLSTQTGS